MKRNILMIILLFACASSSYCGGNGILSTLLYCGTKAVGYTFVTTGAALSYISKDDTGIKIFTNPVLNIAIEESAKKIANFGK